MNKRIASTRDEHPLSSAGAALYQAAASSTARWLLAGFVAGALLVPAEPARAQDMKPETLERVKHATVMVFNAASRSKKGDTPLGSGSGFFINTTGLLITNNHVVDPGHGQSPRKKWEITNKYNLLVQTIITDSGTEDEKEWECDLLYQNEKADQALLQALDEDGDKLRTPNYLRFLPESQLKERLKLVALGFPGGDSRKTSKGDHPEVNIVEGHVIELPRTPAGRVRRIYTDAEVRAGNSGGPMVNVDGLLVGTLTLGIANEERRNFNALVPAKLTREFIRAAFTLGKVPGGADYTPFMEMLTGEDGRLNIPEFPRLRDRDVLFFEDGDRVHGNIATDTIIWESPLGKTTVPTAAVAYVLNNEEGSHLFLEGGNRIASSQAGSSFEFTPYGGAETTVKFDEVRTIGFRTSDRQLNPAVGKIIVLDSELTHLRLADVQGTVTFEGRFPIGIKLEEVARIDTDDDDKQVVTLADGRRLTGKFGEGTYKATVADTGTPIEFGLSGVEKARVDIVRYEPDRVAGLGLLGVLASADRDVRRIAETLDDGDVASARAEVEKILSSKDFRKLPQVKKEQFRLLAAEAALRDGDPKPATKAFRKCLRAKDENISAFAQACSAVLRRFDDFTFQGKPLSNRAVFVEAGSVIADEYIQRVRDLLKDAETFEFRSRTDYVKSISGVKKNEDAMRIAAVFRGPEADDELIRLWNLAAAACQRELARIDDEVKEKQVQGRSGGRGAGKRRQREIDELKEQREEVKETFQTYGMKLEYYGFRIEDPDIQEHKEREDDEDDEEPGDEPDDEPEPDDDEGP